MNEFKDDTLTRFEGYSLLVVCLLGRIMGEAPPAQVRYAGNAAWISQILASLLGIGFYLLCFRLFRRHPDKNLLQICEELLGKAAGRAVQCAVLLYLCLFMAVNLRQIVEMLSLNTYYPHTGALLLSVAIMGAAAFACSGSLRGLGKIVSIFLPAFLLSLALMLLCAYRSYDPTLLLPVLGYGAAPTARMGFFLVSNFGGVLLLGIFMGDYGSTGHYKKSALPAYVTACVCYTATTLLFNMAMPYQAAEHSTSLVDLVKHIYISRFFQRFESVFLFFLAVGMLLVLAVSLMAAKQTYCNLFGIARENGGAVLIPFMLIVVCLGRLMNALRLPAAFLDRLVQRYGVFFALSLVLLLLAAGLLRGKGRGGALRAAGLILIPCITAGMLGGCYREPDEETYDIILGYDKGVHEKYRITVKFMTEEDSGDSDGGAGSGSEGEGPSSNVFVAEAPSSVAAAELIGSVLPRHVSMLHIKMLVVSEEVAREGVDGLVTPIMRHNETKSSMAFVVCRGTAQEFISAKQNGDGQSLPMQVEMIMDPNKGTSLYQASTVSSIYYAYSDSTGDAVAMYGDLSKAYSALQEEPGEGAESAGAGKDAMPPEKAKEGGTPEERTEQGKKEAAGESGEKKEDTADSGNRNNTEKIFIPAEGQSYADGYLPGDIPVYSAARQEIGGMAVFKGDTMAGSINTMETAVFMMLSGSCKGGVFAVADPYSEGDYIVFEIKNRIPTRVKARLDRDGGAQVEMVAYLKGRVVIAQNTGKDYHSHEERALLEEYAERLIKERALALIAKTQNELNGADILRLGRYMAGNFPTIPQWEAYGWPERYKDAAIGVTVNFDL